MEDLIRRVMENAKIDEQAAKTAVETVIRVIKERVPDPLGSQIEQALNGIDVDDLNNAANTLKGLFGGK
jgi:hypothetical protein